MSEPHPSPEPAYLVRPVRTRSFGRWWRLCRKELRETLRDRRTIITLVLMPLLVYPLLSILFQRFLISTAPGVRAEQYLVVTDTEQTAHDMQRLVAVGDALLEEARSGEPTGDNAQHAEDSEDADRLPRLGSRGATSLHDFFLDAPRIEWVTSLEPEAQVRNGAVDLAIILRSRAGEADDIGQPHTLDYELIWREHSATSLAALSYVQQRLQAVNDRYIADVFARAQIQEAPPLRTQSRGVRAEEVAFAMTTLVPLVLILMTITGAVYPAIDLTAGERERGTLEPLMTAPVPRMMLLMGKYVAVMTVALLTATANLVAMTVTLMSTGMGEMVFGPDGISLQRVLQVFALLVLFAAFFSAITLALTSFARSFKEAQAYLIPLMLICLAPGVISLTPGLRFDGLLAVTPLVNIVLLARDVLEGSVEPVLAAVAIGSTALYALAAIAVAARIFGTDAIVYATGASWSDLWRGRQRYPVPTVAGALIWLAVLYPLYFLTANSLARLTAASISERLLLSGVATALLFGGIPALAIILGGFRWRPTLQLRRPRPLAAAGALLLGISLWPLAHEVFRFGQWMGLEAGPETFEAAGQLLEHLKEVPLLVVLLSLALAPAVFEELFFRGFLFSAMRRVMSPLRTILVTSLLFGLFHVVVMAALAPERFLPSLFLGMVLGWVCWRSGSVLPCILLHVAHNGLLLSFAYYRDELIEAGWGVQQQAHLPLTWIAAAVAIALAGAAMLWIGKKEEGNAESR